MPELPEVETVCRGLAQAVAGDVITQVRVYRHDLRLPVPDALPALCHQAVVRRITRRAKYFLIHLDSGQVVIGHLGMSGKMLVYPHYRNHTEKHDHITFRMASGKEMVFHDPRRFGLVVVATEESLPYHPLFAALGPEPLSSHFTPEYLYGALRKKSTPIKPALMDAKLVVGVGNIYASEALFHARIDPQTPAGQLSLRHCGQLVAAVKQVLEAAIASGGSTLRDYVRASGEGGYFQHQFHVYGKEGKPCFGCGLPIKKVQQTGRSTFYCPSCQVRL